MAESEFRRPSDPLDGERSRKRARLADDSTPNKHAPDTSAETPGADAAAKSSKSKSKSKSSGFKWKSKAPPPDVDEDSRKEPRKEKKVERRADTTKEAIASSVVPRPSPVPASVETNAEDDDIASKFGPSYKSSSTATQSSAPPSSTNSTATTNTLGPTKPKSTKSKAPPAPTGPMIIVKINDRLGTTSRVPCLPSDTVGDFKKLVAMRIGRKPHEIMLKRQSERPFKDFLTLEDYGVSDGVQLDLELDTGD